MGRGSGYGNNQLFDVKLVPGTNGKYYSIIGRNSCLYWDVAGAAMHENAKVIQNNRCDDGLAPHQQFEFVDGTDGSFAIKARHSDKAICVQGGSRRDGAKIVQCTSNGHASQRFTCKKMEI